MAQRITKTGTPAAKKKGRGSSVRVYVSEETFKAVEKWQKNLGFKSQGEALLFFADIGNLVLRITEGQPLDAETFANTMYTIAKAIVRGKLSRESTDDLLEELKEWRNTEVYPQRGGGRVLIRPTRRLR